MGSKKHKDKPRVKKEYKNFIEIFPNVFRKGNKLFTLPLINSSVYGEKFITYDGTTLREWVPSRSKLGAAILKGLKLPISKNSLVLYLGAATGTTISHVSDIVTNGAVIGVEFSPTVAISLFSLARQRKNLSFIIEDASFPERYMHLVPTVDVIFQDIAQRHQVEILRRNAIFFLKNKGYAMISIKTRSIDVTKPPKEIYKQVKSQLEKDFEIIQQFSLYPWEKDHYFFLLRFS